MWNSVHYGSKTRFNKAIEQKEKSIEWQKCHVGYTIGDMVVELVLNNKDLGIEKCIRWECKKDGEIDYNKIKAENGLVDKRDIVWMKFTTDGFLGVVADSNDINYDIPSCSEEYDNKTERGEWKYTSSGILIHYLGLQWDESFVLIFPLIKISAGKTRHYIEKQIGNYLIDQGIPILDYYSHKIGR